MQALMFSLVVLAALPALAQTGAPSKEALGLGGRISHAAQPQLEKGLQTIVDGLASGYRNSATQSGEAVDEKILAEAVKNEFTAARPLLWDGMARVYAETYSLDELKTLDGYYRAHPGDPAGLPANLTAKDPLLQQHEQELIGQIGPRIMQDMFGEYCSRAACSNNVRRTVGLPPK